MTRASAAHNPGVSLFPFLAVLICTMGVMMLLLVIINRPGAAAIDDSTPPPDAVFEEGGKGSAATLASGNGGASSAPNDELQSAREMLDWRISQLETSREKTIGDLRNERLRLSTVEDGMRKLHDQWELVKKAVGDLAQADTAKDHDKQAVAAFVDRLKSDLNATHERIGKAIQEAHSEPPAFAIVPYDGPNGTRRQPIYIECRSDAVVLQPEGIALTENDFKGPRGPGNPLASTIRAARDFLAGGTAPTPGREPYPLLIVRSDGIVAFYMAKSAMASWASDYGYELIEADRKLVFLPPNPQLAQLEKAALTDARQRYAWFATTRTGQEAQSPRERPVYRASRAGGIEREGEASLADADGTSSGAGGGTSGFGSPGSRFGGGGNGGTASGFGAGGNGSVYTSSGAVAGNGTPGSGTGTGNGSGSGAGVGTGVPGVATAGGPGGGQPYVPGSNYIGLSGGAPGGSGNGTGGSSYGAGNSGYGTGGNGGVPGGPGIGSGGGTGVGSGPGNGIVGGPSPIPGNAYTGLPGSGGQGSGGQGGAGSGYGTGGAGGGLGGVPGGGAGGIAGGPAGYGAGNSTSGVGGLGGGTASGIPGGPNTGYVGSPGTGLNGSGGAPGSGVPGGNSSAGYVPSGTQSMGSNGVAGSGGSYSPSGFSGGNSAQGGNLANGQAGSSGASGAPPGDPNSPPPPGTPTSNVTVSQAGTSGSQYASDGGDGAPPSGMPTMMMNTSSPPPRSSSSLDNINATPYPLQSGPTGPRPGEYVESPPPPTYSDKPKPADDNAPKSHDSLAEKRGHNWSLPATSKLSTPVSRTIHIECRGDCLILKPDFGNPKPRVIPFGPRTADSVDKLVAAVWDYTKGWGIAGRQMYWKPRLELDLGLSGEGRYSELQALLADSGLEVARKQTTAASTTTLR